LVRFLGDAKNEQNIKGKTDCYGFSFNAHTTFGNDPESVRFSAFHGPNSGDKVSFNPSR